MRARNNGAHAELILLRQEQVPVRPSVSQLRHLLSSSQNWLPFIRDEGIFFVSILEVSELRFDFAYLGGFSISPSLLVQMREDRAVQCCATLVGRAWHGSRNLHFSALKKGGASGAESPDENCHAPRSRSPSRSSR